jgi:hypothetical protein
MFASEKDIYIYIYIYLYVCMYVCMYAWLFAKYMGIFQRWYLQYFKDFHGPFAVPILFPGSNKKYIHTDNRCTHAGKHAHRSILVVPSLDIPKAAAFL